VKNSKKTFLLFLFVSLVGIGASALKSFVPFSSNNTVFKTLYYRVVSVEKQKIEKEKTFSPLTPRIGLDLIDPHSIIL
jgi:hypothetical protein